MTAKPVPPKEMVLIALVFPLLGILMGGIYSYPAMRLTKERDPWLTLLLEGGLAITVFGIGYTADSQPFYLVPVWLVSVLFLLLARAAFGNLGHNFERFGMVHMAALLILFWVLFFTRSPKQSPPNHALQRNAPCVAELVVVKISINEQRHGFDNGHPATPATRFPAG